MRVFSKALALTSFTILATGAATASPLSFVWMPPTDHQTVDVGTNVTVALWALPNPDPMTNISGFEAVVLWNQSLLSFVSYTPFASPNNTFTNDVGIGDLSIFDFSPSFNVPAGGTHLGDITFHTVAAGDSTVSMAGTGVIGSGGSAYGVETTVYRYATYGGNFVPDYSSVAYIHAGPVPEPASMATLLVGGALLMRRLRRR